MTNPPILPTGFSLPDMVNGWQRTTDTGYNAHVWQSPDGDSSVGVYESINDHYYIKVVDERISGSGGERIVHETDVADNRLNPDASNRSPPMIETAVQAAVEWMESNSPPWCHPDVVETALSPPDGFVVDSYYITHQQHKIHYIQTGDKSPIEMAGRRVDTPATLETRKYLHIEVYNGSGDATISLSPYANAHAHEKTPAVEPLEGVGVETAIQRAREWVADQREEQASSVLADGGDSTPDTDDDQLNLTTF